MSDPRKHHFISQCYLKGFTVDARKDCPLFAVNLADGSTFQTKPLNVAAERDFNRAEGLPPGAVENALVGFETQVDAALTRIRQLKSIEDSDDWMVVLNLAALFTVRNPRWREIARDAIERLSRAIMDLALATPERWESQVRAMREDGVIKGEPKATYEQMKKFHEEGNYTVEVATGAHLLREFGVHEPILETMAARRWVLCIAGQESGGFITSDHPVCLMHADGTLPTPKRPVGHGMRDTMVVFPLSSELLAIGTFEGAKGVADLDSAKVAQLNGIVGGFGERQIYARDDSFRVVIGGEPESISCAELCRWLAECANI